MSRARPPRISNEKQPRLYMPATSVRHDSYEVFPSGGRRPRGRHRRRLGDLPRASLAFDVSNPLQNHSQDDWTKMKGRKIGTAITIRIRNKGRPEIPTGA